MPFKPGKSGNPKGRRRGAKNRTTAEIQQALMNLLDRHLNAMSGDLKKMKPKDRATLLINLAKHVTPAAMQPERLSEEQLEQIIEFLETKNKNEKAT